MDLLKKYYSGLSSGDKWLLGFALALIINTHLALFLAVCIIIMHLVKFFKPIFEEMNRG